MYVGRGGGEGGRGGSNLHVRRKGEGGGGVTSMYVGRGENVSLLPFGCDLHSNYIVRYN